MMEMEKSLKFTANELLDSFNREFNQDEMNEIRKLDSGKRFFNMTLEQQEQMLGSWKPED